MKKLQGKSTVIFIPYFWLVIFCLLPFLLIIIVSFSEFVEAIPPFEIPISFLTNNKLVEFHFNFESYKLIIDDDLYVEAFGQSIILAILSTFLTLVIAYPIAYAISLSPKSLKNLLLLLVIIPFWTSLLIRVYSWTTILKTEGFLNQLLLALGVIKEPLVILNTNIAVIIGIIYCYLPFMVLPIYSSLEKINHNLREAASDLGAKPFAVFKNITLPLSMPGVIAGSALVFIPVIGEFVIPDLLGGPNSLLIGKVIWNEFFLNRDWPAAAAVSIILSLVIILPIIILQNVLKKKGKV